MEKDKDRTPVAQDVIAMCTRCKMELNHIVVAHNIAGIVERVKCYTCGSEHKYRRTKKASVSRNGVKRSAIKRNDPGKDFQVLIERLADKTPVPYNMSESYNNDDVIAHSTFGKGVVVHTSVQKMDVIFAEGSRTLAMDRK